MYIKLLGILKWCCRLFEMESTYSFLHYSSIHSSFFLAARLADRRKHSASCPWLWQPTATSSIHCHLQHPLLSPENKSLAEFSCFSEHLSAEWKFLSLPHRAMGLHKINSLLVPDLFSFFFLSTIRYYVCTETRLLTNFWASSHFISVKSS